MSDIWATIYIGKLWAEDDGEQKGEVDQAQEVQVTVADFDPLHPGFTLNFESAKKEFLRSIDEQLRKMKMAMIREVQVSNGSLSTDCHHCGKPFDKPSNHLDCGRVPK